MRRSWWVAACAAAVLGWPTTVLAQQGGQRDEHHEDDEDAGLDPLERLKKIAALMEQVEGRLFEADTGDFTLEEQRRIVEAMKFEAKSADALERLIHDLEKKSGQ
jgi:hypothetical protein